MIVDLDVRPLLAALRGPALVMHGTRDAVVPVGHARAIAADIGPRAELRLVEGADHMANPHLWRKTGFVMDWLARRLHG